MRGTARGRTETVLVTRWDGAVARRSPDELIVEEPMAIQLDGQLVATTMRTPGHDYELAAGFCLTEGLLHGAPVTGVRYCATGPASETEYNVVTVDTEGRAPEPTPRLTPTTSSCGLCGSAELDELVHRLAPLPADRLARFTPTQLGRLAGAALDAQPLFTSTGAVHAAVALDGDAGVVVAREDVGRHNAVDKVVGRLLLDGRLPAHDLALAVTSRASFEIVQKAWAAGFAALVAVSAPTALAVSAARRAGMTLAGFARVGRLNVYAPERLPG
jgi:FdhD protein